MIKSLCEAKLIEADGDRDKPDKRENEILKKKLKERSKGKK
jgi:hypothetical protein